MQGEFRGDFTRDTFDPQKHFLRVLTQQGRVQIDADPNEQASILIHYLQTLATDLMGEHAAPPDNLGFAIVSTLPSDDPDELKNKLKEAGFLIRKGNYYVKGILCENDRDFISYYEQPDPPVPKPKSPKNPLESGKNYLVYLDVLERHINYVQDEIFGEENLLNSSIREVALGGADTATRSKIVWQVKFLELTPKDLQKGDSPADGSYTSSEYGKEIKDNYAKFLSALVNNSISHPGTGKLKARAKSFDTGNADPCIIKPSASYRGTENQLYRVEIHDPGLAYTKDNNSKEVATFKWSRENSAVVFPILEIVSSSSSEAATVTVTLAHLGRDNRFSLEEGDWTEIVDDDYIWQNLAKPLLKVEAIDQIDLKVTLSGKLENGLGQDPKKHPYLRRWDRNRSTSVQSKSGDESGVRSVVEGDWLSLENGIEISFPKPEEGSPLVFRYQTGDYWLIPARAATGDVEWPRVASDPSDLMPLPPHGIVHHYAPLAILAVEVDGKISSSASSDCRRKLKQLWTS